MNIDFYLQHPREKKPLEVGGVLIKDSKKIAEQTIFELSDTKRPKIFAWFTTVLFNVNEQHADKVYLSIGNQQEEIERIELCKKVGCEVVRIGG